MSKKIKCQISFWSKTRLVADAKKLDPIKNAQTNFFIRRVRQKITRIHFGGASSSSCSFTTFRLGRAAVIRSSLLRKASYLTEIMLHDLSEPIDETIAVALTSPRYVSHSLLCAAVTSSFFAANCALTITFSINLANLLIAIVAFVLTKRISVIA